MRPVALASLVAVLAASALGAQLQITADRPPSFGELRQVQYVVGFGKHGPPEGVQGRLIPMRSSNGSRFQCYVPHQQGVDEGETAEEVPAENQLASQKTPEELLDTLTDWCTYRLEDWWHYEVCYKKHVRQFHKEGSKVASEYVLGRYDAAASDAAAILNDTSDVQGGVKYVAHQYTSGEPCELTGQPRSAEVRFLCGPDSEGIITSLQEPRSCHYRITIRTLRLCKHPAFQEQPLPVSVIRCYHEEQEGAAAAAEGGGGSDAGEASEGQGTCSAGGEGARRRHIGPERVTASSSSGPAAGEGGGEDAAEEGGNKRLLKSLLDQANGFEEDYEDEGYYDD
eukprot:scaffold21.g2107.t1